MPFRFWPALFVSLLCLTACGDRPKTQAAGSTMPQKGKPSIPEPSLNALKTEDIKVGDGNVQGVIVPADVKVGEGDLVTVQYRGTFTDGKEFDSNMKPGGKPFTFTVGKGEVVKGWDQGLLGMRIGGERKLSIPYSLGFGEEGSPPTVPARADLIFTVKVLDIVKAGQETVVDKNDIRIGSGPAAKEGDLVSVFYTGRFVTGEQFDSNEGKSPMSFTIGAGEMVPGFDAAATGMKAGGERLIRIPPALAYGASGAREIPGNSTLVFKVKLVSIR